MKTSESLTELITALVSFQSSAKAIEKSAQGYGYTYAPLDKVIESIRESLAGCGLSFVQFPATPPVEYHPAVALTTRLMHLTGEWMEDTMIIPVPQVGKANDAQNYGAALTYARRYALTSILGLATDEDVDAAPKQESSQNGRKSVAKAKDIKPPMPTTAMQRKFHALGTKKYGDAWDDKRPELCKAISKRRQDGPTVTSSNDLYRAEMQELINGMDKEPAEEGNDG